MSDTTTGSSFGYDGDDIRPLSVRMTGNTRAQLDIIAQLNDRSVTEEVREALEFWIEKSRSDPKLRERGEKVRADIEREAALRRGAIDSVLDKAKPSPKPAVTSPPTKPADK